ncbi:putative glutathione s-transferase protein [Botrytis fragariae]|uniref:Putative glutathione s-transferase protein n=1 Tax=Botrytis fragariae TaxID=1964551 RepID=A0A8H6ATQ4_9HELO|nr:putative glutathione s-transferase protein [Botrytis fragariae]KAF5873215.1 putative glutathione s-transferase protein [Botrytis fragariae]
MASTARQQSVPKDGNWHGRIEVGGEFPPETDRYHLYIGLFCPFAHRVNLIRHLKGLTSILPISIVKPYPKGDDKGWPGWKFATETDPYPGATGDHLFRSKYLHQVYFRSQRDYKGRFSVPVLWDKKTNQIVCNESLEILRNLNTGFDSILDDEYKILDFYPENLAVEIDEMGEWMQNEINTGVYKAGFAPNQETYDKNVVPLFKALNRMEEIIKNNGGPYVLGSEMTELDLRLYPTICRFDAAYVQHFKCNLGTIRHDYPVLNAWLKHLYWEVKGFKESTNFKHIKENYTKSHADINPKAITPMGPIPNIERGVDDDWSKLVAGRVELD